MQFLENGNELFIVVEYVTRLTGFPVNVDLIGITIQIFKVCVRRNLCACFRQPIWHNNQFADIFPIEPRRKNRLTVIDPVRQDAVDFNNIDGLASYCSFYRNPYRQLSTAESHPAGYIPVYLEYFGIDSAFFR